MYIQESGVKPNSYSTASLRNWNASYESSLLGSFEGIFNAMLPPALIVALPSLPRLVVIKMTPLAPFTP